MDRNCGPGMGLRRQIVKGPVTYCLLSRATVFSLRMHDYHGHVYGILRLGAHERHTAKLAKAENQ